MKNKFLIKCLFILILPLVTTNCTTTEEIYTWSNQQLCMHHLTKPSINIHHNTVASILSMRNENCARYIGQAQLVIERERLRMEQMEYWRKLGESGKPRPLNTQQGTHTYIIDGKMVTCTTTGTVTNCF